MRSIKRPRGLLTPYFLPVLHLPLTPCFFTPGGHASPSGGRQRLAELWSPPGDYSGPAAANRAVRNTRETERWSPTGTVSGQPGCASHPGTGSGQPGDAAHPGDRQRPAGRWNPPMDRQRSAGRCGPLGGPSVIAQPGTGSDLRAVRPIRGPVAASRAVELAHLQLITQKLRDPGWVKHQRQQSRPAFGVLGDPCAPSTTSTQCSNLITIQSRITDKKDDLNYPRIHEQNGRKVMTGRETKGSAKKRMNGPKPSEP